MMAVQEVSSFILYVARWIIIESTRFMRGLFRCDKLCYGVATCFKGMSLDLDQQEWMAH